MFPQTSMKSVRGTKSKKNNTYMSIALAGAAVIMVGILVFTTARMGFITIPGITPPKEVTPINTESVGYLTDAAAAGTDADSIVTFHTVDLDAETTILPDDVITQSDDLDGYVLKYDLYANTPLCWSMVCPRDTENLYTDATRDISVDFIEVQGDAQVGDYVDVRLSVSNTKNAFGLENGVVLAKKEIIALDGNNVTLRLNEDEQILLMAAQVESTIVNASDAEEEPTAFLYTAKYVNTAQKASTVTYTNEKAVELMKTNPNLINDSEALYEAMTDGENDDNGSGSDATETTAGAENVSEADDGAGDDTTEEA